MSSLLVMAICYFIKDNYLPVCIVAIIVPCFLADRYQLTYFGRQFGNEQQLYNSIKYLIQITYNHFFIKNNLNG